MSRCMQRAKRALEREQCDANHSSAVGDDHFGRGGGRGRAHVGGEVGNGEIDFVADRR